MEQPNTNYIDQLSGDDAAFKIKMISIIKKELPLEIIAYKEYLRQKDFKQTAQCVHKLKHKISVLGLEKSYYLAEQFEDNLKEGSLTLQSDFDTIIASMHNFVNSL